MDIVIPSGTRKQPVDELDPDNILISHLSDDEAVGEGHVQQCRSNIDRLQGDPCTLT